MLANSILPQYFSHCQYKSSERQPNHSGITWSVCVWEIWNRGRGRWGGIKVGRMLAWNLLTVGTESFMQSERKCLFYPVFS